eukprot:scaffold427606_cov14-Prasinocladus_malaysianus.AAC.1
MVIAAFENTIQDLFGDVPMNLIQSIAKCVCFCCVSGQNELRGAFARFPRIGPSGPGMFWRDLWRGNWISTF